MNFLRNAILPILLATIWISGSEFIRNEVVLKSYWTDHYESLGLVFPSEPLNGAIWGIWSLFFAIAIYVISRKFSFIQTIFIAWFVGFVLMWIVLGNMGVLPLGLLYLAVPLSIFEVLMAVLIMVNVAKSKS